MSMCCVSKVCGRCNNLFPNTIENFKPSKDCRGGLTGTCRSCNASYHRAWKKKNKRRLAPLRRQQYKQRYGAIQRAKEETRKKEYPIRVRAQLLRGGMKERSKDLDIPFDSEYFTVSVLMTWISSDPKCECCSRKLDVGFKLDRMKHDDSPSIDRLIPRLGYVRGNVSLLCWRCNNLKRDATLHELKTVCKWLKKKDAHRRGAGVKKVLDGHENIRASEVTT